MKVKSLIWLLNSADPEAEVLIFDPDFEDWKPVTGMTHGGRDGKVKLYTDDPND